MVDREIAPVWHDRFARLIVRNLPPISGLFALDIHCGPGRLTSEILQRTDPRSRVLALEPDEALLSLAKSRIKPEWRKRVYHKPGNFDDITTMGDATYDLTVANLVLSETHDLSNAFGEMMRITKPGGHVMATLPLSGTWEEAEDIFDEVLRDAGLRAASKRLQRFRSLRQRPRILAEILRSTGVPDANFVIEHERLQVLFPSGREFLFAPVIEHGPLRLWKAIIGNDGKPPELFWKLKEAIDTYYAGHVLSVSIVAGLIHIQKPDPMSPGTLAADYWQHYPSLDKLWGGMAHSGTSGHGRPLLPFSDIDVDEFDLDIDIDDDFDMGDEPAPAPAPEPEPAFAPEPEPGTDSGVTRYAFDDAMRASELPPQPDAFDEDMVTRPREVEPASAPTQAASATRDNDFEDDFDPLAGTFLPDESEPAPASAQPESEPDTEPEPDPELGGIDPASVEPEQLKSSLSKRIKPLGLSRRKPSAPSRTPPGGTPRFQAPSFRPPKPNAPEPSPAVEPDEFVSLDDMEIEAVAEELEPEATPVPRKPARSGPRRPPPPPPRRKKR